MSHLEVSCLVVGGIGAPDESPPKKRELSVACDRSGIAMHARREGGSRLYQSRQRGCPSIIQAIQSHCVSKKAAEGARRRLGP